MIKRAHFAISDELLREVDALVGSRQRSAFFAEAAAKELVRRRQLQALDGLVPWSEEDHPELKDGAAKHVRRLRRESEERFRKVTRR